MSEGSKKTEKAQRSRLNAAVVERLKEKYGLSKYFIHESIKGNRNSETSAKIRKEYKVLIKKVEAALK